MEHYRRMFGIDPIWLATAVKTFDGEWVWRRRHYRVRRAAEPGAFYFSVLDNGVTSNGAIPN